MPTQYLVWTRQFIFPFIIDSDDEEIAEALDIAVLAEPDTAMNHHVFSYYEDLHTKCSF